MSLKVPTVHEVSYKTYMINMFGMQSPSLVVGEERALLIDTGVGNYDLKGLVESITALPYDVVITHGHGDHIGGLGQFSQAYVHPADWQAVETFDAPFLAQYIQRMLPHDTWGCFDCPQEIMPWQYRPQLLPLEDGQMFDLGGRRVTAYAAPGHTPGEMVFVDDRSRILFSGDAANCNLGLGATTVETALAGLRNIKSHEAEFDRNFTGHLGWAGNLERAVSEGPEILDTCLAICQGIVDGTRHGEEMDAGIFGRRCCIIDHGVRVSYDPQKVHG